MTPLQSLGPRLVWNHYWLFLKGEDPSCPYDLPNLIILARSVPGGYPHVRPDGEAMVA